MITHIIQYRDGHNEQWNANEEPSTYRVLLLKDLEIRHGDPICVFVAKAKAA